MRRERVRELCTWMFTIIHLATTKHNNNNNNNSVNDNNNNNNNNNINNDNDNNTLHMNTIQANQTALRQMSIIQHATYKITSHSLPLLHFLIEFSLLSIAITTVYMLLLLITLEIVTYPCLPPLQCHFPSLLSIPAPLSSPSLTCPLRPHAPSC